MENEAAFEADAEIDELEQIRSRPSHRSTQKRRHIVKPVLGASGFERNTHDEESPLLSPDREDRGSGTSGPGAGEARGPSRWDGEGDFEGRPWWNKPSVRWPRSRHNNVQADQYL